MSTAEILHWWLENQVSLENLENQVISDNFREPSPFGELEETSQFREAIS